MNFNFNIASNPLTTDQPTSEDDKIVIWFTTFKNPNANSFICHKIYPFSQSWHVRIRPHYFIWFLNMLSLCIWGLRWSLPPLCMRFEFSFKCGICTGAHQPSWPVSFVIKPIWFISTFAECLLPVGSYVRPWEFNDAGGTYLALWWSSEPGESPSEWRVPVGSYKKAWKAKPVNLACEHRDISQLIHNTVMLWSARNGATGAETHVTPPKH